MMVRFKLLGECKNIEMNIDPCGCVKALFFSV